MSATNMHTILEGMWSYRSLNNDPNLSTSFNDLEFGQGTIRIDSSPLNEFSGLIFGPGWELDLKGSINYGDPFCLRFQGKGVIGGNEWIYNYVGYMVNPWINGINQVPAIVGSIVRVIPHPGGDGGLHPAGVVASWYAVKQKESTI